MTLSSTTTVTRAHLLAAPTGVRTSMVSILCVRNKSAIRGRG